MVGFSLGCFLLISVLVVAWERAAHLINYHGPTYTILFKIHPTIKRTEGVIRKTNKLMRKISASKGLTSQEKVVQLRLLKQRKNEAMRRTHSRFLEIANLD